MATDTRVTRVLSLLDELRTDALELIEELPTTDPTSLFMARLRQRVNDSIRELKSLP